VPSCGRQDSIAEQIRDRSKTRKTPRSLAPPIEPSSSCQFLSLTITVAPRNPIVKIDYVVVDHARRSSAMVRCYRSTTRPTPNTRTWRFGGPIAKIVLEKAIPNAAIAISFAAGAGMLTVARWNAILQFLAQ
jgi:hypothetical protein